MKKNGLSKKYVKLLSELVMFFCFFLQRTIAIRYSQDPGAEFDVTSFNYENKCHIMILSGTLLWELAN